MKPYHGSREEADDYTALQTDLARYERVCSEINMLECDNGAWAAGRFYNEAIKRATERLAALRLERASLEHLCGIDPHPTP